MSVIQPAIDAGDITIVGEAFSDGWKPENAQKNMEQILTAANNDVLPFCRRTTVWPAVSWRLWALRA